MTAPGKEQPELKDIADIHDKAFRKSFVQDVMQVGTEAGDWRIHPPYAVLIAYRSDTIIRRKFKSHVENCTYCQKLLDALCTNSND